MKKLIEQYNRVYAHIKELSAQIAAEQDAIDQMSRDRSAQIRLTVQELQEKIARIDATVQQIGGLRKIAMEHINSLSCITVEAPEGYRVNLKRLRQWTELINPYPVVEDGETLEDPYARRVYVVACNDLFFLDKKRTEFTRMIRTLETGIDRDMEAAVAAHLREKNACMASLCSYAHSEEVRHFASALKEASDTYWHMEVPETFEPGERDAFAPGAFDIQLPIPDDAQVRAAFAEAFGAAYDVQTSRLLLPLELEQEKEFVIQIECTTAKTQMLDRGIQNLILNVIEQNRPGSRRIYYLDAARYNSAGLGTLRRLEDTFALEKVPRNAEQMSEVLETILASFDDVDEVIGYADSVAEYNAGVKTDSALPRTLLILNGWPRSFTAEHNRRISRIMSNYERYGVSFVVAGYYRNQEMARLQQNETLPEYADQNAIHIRYGASGSTMSIGEEAPYRFRWFYLKHALSDGYVDAVRNLTVRKKVIGNDYTARCDMYTLPEYMAPDYKRAYQPVELPYGIDGKDKEYKLSFERENFAAFLMGASRSGKSTLLHTLITGIVRNYHPDNVELWLADFKMLEFKKYMDHCPPHVKYILLDESSELVYDLIDKLTDVMLERQRAFARLGVERLDQIDPQTLDAPMPVIFVILDEFSLMSQAIADSDVYKLRLQNLLAKGAALGIKFLFASQTFTSGVGGLTTTARAQIQQRIAMKAEASEISETLDLSSALKTDKVANWMDALPPHYALVKCRFGADVRPDVIRVHALYIPDYAVRDALIDKIARQMQPVDAYCPKENNTYVDKHRVLVDGNSYEAFSADALAECLAAEQNDDGWEQTVLTLGAPRLMAHVRPIVVTDETRENLLLIGKPAEKMCAASVLTSMLRAFLLQGRKVQVWAYERNGIYTLCREQVWVGEAFRGIEYVVGIDAICDAVRDLKEKIRNKVEDGTLILLLGMDRICCDFDFLQGDTAASTPSEVAEAVEASRAELDDQARRSGASVGTFEELLDTRMALLWDDDEQAEQARANGVSEAELPQHLEAAEAAFREKLAQTLRASAAEQEPKPASQPEPKPEPKPERGAYAAQADFQYVLKMGSRMGYHFAMFLYNYSDLKMTGARLEWFRHRLSFQLSVDESRDIFSTRAASTLPEHVCEYSDTLYQFSFRPYLHGGLSWEGWTVDEQGTVISPFTEETHSKTAIKKE